MRIFEQGIEVAGVNYRHFIARRFVKGSKRKLYLQREPDNKLDSNAMRVMGKSKGWFFQAEKCIGYVPSDIAKKLVNSGIQDKVKVRLQLISIEDRDSIRIRFNLLGPMDDYEKYCA